MKKTITITEALAEIKLLTQKVADKQANICNYVAMPSDKRDPLDKQGGSESYVAAEMQSVRDILERIVQIRLAINQCNAATTLEVDGVKKTVAEWLIWNRDYCPYALMTLRQIYQRINSERSKLQGRSIVTGQTKPDDIIVNLSEKDLMAEIEALNQTSGKLDGMLSLNNATVTIEV